LVIIAHYALREVAFLKNRTLLVIVVGLIILAAIGVAGSYIANPTGFLKSVGGILLIGAVIYFIIRYFSRSNPEKREQRAFIKAAKKSKKRLQQKEAGQFTRRTTPTITSIKRTLKPKKKPTSHLTVIEGRKGKKKNRASF
jgi:uncharacterized membrane protein YfcA